MTDKAPIELRSANSSRSLTKNSSAAFRATI